ncbi:MAG: radical SAM protein, partial [Candidatus Eremiobacteraeota bacterium]|nr:radical SAM protein [Candidatus Eremiobacteraeota bacterium]
MPDFKRTLFLNPPSYEGFDGGAGARYQCRREVRSFWYPTWLAQPAAMVPGSKLVDAPPDDLTIDDVAPMAKDYDLIVIHTSTPSFENDARVAARLKQEHPGVEIGFVGAHVAVLPEQCLKLAPDVDWVATQEFDYTCVELAQGKPWAEVGGIAYRSGGDIVRTPDRPTITDMDAFPSVLDVYKRDLTIPNYFNGYLQHPYISLYTGRGCKSRCTFCIWPQTISGHLYRVRGVDSVEAEMARGKAMFPEVKEWFFDDDTLTDNAPRVEEIARRLGKLGITWSCNAKPNVARSTLEVLKDNGLRLLLVGYESGVQDILNSMKKGTRLDHIREFTKNCH